MRLVAVIGCALLLELGWLGLWPLSVRLSHSALFTSSLLARYPALAPVLGADAPLTDPLGSATYVTPATELAVLLMAVFAIYALSLFIVAGANVRLLRLIQVTLVAAAVVFQLTLLAMPGLFSQDVFSYIAYGRAAALYGLNPYIWPPSVLHDPVLPWVAEIWRTYPSPYGPLWVSLQWLIATLTAGLTIADQALVYRALASLLLLVNLALAWRLLGRLTPLSPSQRTAALIALAWNPVMLFEVAGNAHNDALMVTFCLLGLLLLERSTRRAVFDAGVSAGLLSSAAALALGTLVKYLSGLGLIWLLMAAGARGHTWPRRLGQPLVLGLVAIGVAAVAFAPWLELPDSLDPLVNETARVGYVNSLPDTLVRLLLDTLGAADALGPARIVERILIVGIFAAYLAWETRRVCLDPGPSAVARALAYSALLSVVLVSTSMQTWYLCLPLSVAVVLGLRALVARLALIYSALALPALYVSYYLRAQTPGWISVLYACAPLVVLLSELLAVRFAQRWTKYCWAARRHYCERPHSTASAAGTPASTAI